MMLMSMPTETPRGGHSRVDCHSRSSPSPCLYTMNSVVGHGGGLPPADLSDSAGIYSERLAFWTSVLNPSLLTHAVCSITQGCSGPHKNASSKCNTFFSVFDVVHHVTELQIYPYFRCGFIGMKSVLHV